MRVIQAMLGHESIGTTEIYTHIDTSTLREEILNHHPRNIKWARENGIDRSKSSETIGPLSHFVLCHSPSPIPFPLLLPTVLLLLGIVFAGWVGWSVGVLGGVALCHPHCSVPLPPPPQGQQLPDPDGPVSVGRLAFCPG